MQLDFNWKIYLLLNPDLIINNINSENKVKEHYLKYGINENRKYKIDIPNSELEKIDLHKGLYFFIQKNRFHELKSENESLYHYYLIRQKNDNIIKNFQELYQEYKQFNFIAYLYNNKDLLKNNIITQNHCFIHYIQNGIKEKRNKNKNIAPFFDWRLYKLSYNDINIIITYKDAINHYINYGIDEERFYWKNLSKYNSKNIIYENIFSYFDESFYINLNKLSDKKYSINQIYNHWILEKKKHNLNTNIDKIINTNNFITFIIPTIGRKSLQTTLYSLKKLKKSNWKAIVIFDGVKNNCSIKDERIIYLELDKKKGSLKNENTHHNYAGYVRNYGFSYCKNTDWVAFIDDDDYIHPFYIDYLKKEIEEESFIDICLFRLYNNKNVIPFKNDEYIIKNHCGISFAIKKNVCETILFKNDECEDYIFLKEAEYKGFTIVISNMIAYLANIKKKYITKINKQITQLNHYNNYINNNKKNNIKNNFIIDKNENILDIYKFIEEFDNHIYKYQYNNINILNDEFIINIQKDIMNIPNINNLVNIKKNYINL